MKLFFSRAFKWLTTNFIVHLKFMIILILTALLVYIFSLISDVIFKFYYVIALFLFGTIILATLYIKDLSKYDEKIRLFDNIAQDLKVQYLIKEITFDNKSLEDNSAISSVTRKIQNKMEEHYQKFLISIQSHEWVPQFEDVNFKFQGIPTTGITRSSASPVLSRRAPMKPEEIETLTGEGVRGINSNQNESNEVVYYSEFYVPLQLKSTESKEFEVYYRTKAFENAIKGKKDWVTADIDHVSERFSFHIILKDKFEEKYKIKQCEEIDPMPHMGKLCFQIIDQSNQRMILSEKELDKNHNVPFFSDSKVEWTVLNPKMGYIYKLFFTLEERK